ncbi:MAG: glycosyltransferase [Acidobacteriota bacterium]|nr:glycosyltransferase [Acidobacteriota bacterium]OQB54888.1 MAG: Undecaprenyl-phosphate 4-deoxy-4-formamido-L-arabinose transferase [Candidatus Aminicenantes bacterium ADurb.Bin147]HNQ79680.1 glycosyltransferase [Candidatus Aminicenantes bacterium]MDD8034472.1 glycosyltransferase [Acidobacteriota bacterium]MDW3228137.1 glycosyltransferase [Acidobacteriota bacterium]
MEYDIRKNDPEHPQVSIVVPFYNEEGNVEEMHRRLKAVLEQTGRTCEIIYVDDGSRDRTYEMLRAIYQRDPAVRVIKLRRNFGQTAGLQAGFDHVRGDIIISMDGDLQHAPEEIPQFLAKIDEGYDIVSGWRVDRKDNALFRKFPSKVANRIMGRLVKVKIHDFGTTYKAYRREVISSIRLFGELHRFIPALISREGFKITEIPISNINRLKGKSNYGISRVKRVFFDLITVKFMVSFIDRPLQIFGLLGMVFGSAGFLIAAVITVGFYFLSWNIKENMGNLIFSVFLMILGIFFIMIGLLAEVVSRIYFQTHRIRIYSVDRIDDRTGDDGGRAA